MTKKDATLLLEIKRFIDANLEKEITVRDMCRQFVINRTKLQSCFQELFYDSVYAYILRQRMEMAANRLLHSDDPIKVIALDCGYRQQRSFTKSFKIFFKDSPLSYRRKHQPPGNDLRLSISD